MIPLTDEQMVAVSFIDRFVHGLGSRTIRKRIMRELAIPGKRCCCCKRFLDLHAFNRNKNSPDKRHHVCRECMTERYGKGAARLTGVAQEDTCKAVPPPA